MPFHTAEKQKGTKMTMAPSHRRSSFVSPRTTYLLNLHLTSTPAVVIQTKSGPRVAKLFQRVAHNEGDHHFFVSHNGITLKNAAPDDFRAPLQRYP